METIIISISPTAGTVDLLTDDGDTETGYWLGREVPSSAARRLDIYQALATEWILAEIEGAEVAWNSAQVATSGAVELVEVTYTLDDSLAGDIDAAAEAEGRCEEVRELVDVILGDALMEASEAEVVQEIATA